MFVTVGTDGFPFDRLVRWIDAWAGECAAPGLTCMVQHGTARPPAHASARSSLSYPEMRDVVARASVIVTHAGPATIQLCLDQGKKPIVVPRCHRFGEVVDDHQTLFARRLRASGEIELAESEAELRDRLDALLADPGAALAATSGDRGAGAARRFDELVTGLRRTRQGALRRRAGEARSAPPVSRHPGGGDEGRDGRLPG